MRGPERTMADFIQSRETKSAVRKLTDPIADVVAFDTFTLLSYDLIQNLSIL